ncbi:hypothetical protein O3P69_007134 [Scylla paramamosain]|uniref:Uncharacterized protein n=1 Tax=Scylla paramamosain TaxID=85552 RepID=A0AAW0V1Z0_SCYPA
MRGAGKEEALECRGGAGAITVWRGADGRVCTIQAVRPSYCVSRAWGLVSFTRAEGKQKEWESRPLKVLRDRTGHHEARQRFSTFLNYRERLKPAGQHHTTTV